MGTTLSVPKTEKSSDDGENDHLRYGLSSMQGWRATMEDAHAAHLDLDASTSFFGVYDGHGAAGSPARPLSSRHCAAHVPQCSSTCCLKVLVIPARERGYYKRNYVLFCSQQYVMDAQLTPKFSGKVVAKFCAKYLHQQVLKNEAYIAGDIGTSLQESFFRMDEMMRGQRGWRELAVLGDKIKKFNGKMEGLIWSPRSRDGKDQDDGWAFEEGPHSSFAGPTSGSTACVAIIRNNQLFVANAGDSRCVICRKGQAYDLSTDHKPDLEIEKERILKAGGFVQAGRVNGSLSLARAIGDMEFKQNRFLSAEKQMVTANPDINTVELCDEDEFIVLACDGIWDCLSSQQLVDFVGQQLLLETKLSAVCERVLDRCLAPTVTVGEGCDNMTMILVQFKKQVQSSAPA